MNGGVAILRVFTGLDIIARVAVAEPLRENLIEYRILNPFRLDIVGQ